MFGIKFNRFAKTSAATVVTPAPAPAVAQPVVEEEAPTPVAAPAPTLTKLERFEKAIKERNAAEAAEAKAFAEAQAEAEAIKAEYIAKVQAEKAELEAARALAAELQLADESLKKAAERASNARQNADDLAVKYAQSLVVIKSKKDAEIDALLAEFGC